MEKKNVFLRFLQDILYISGMQANKAGLLYELLIKTNLNNQIVLNSFVKKEIADKLNLNKGTIDNAITKFVENEFLIRLDRGIYQPNPNYFPEDPQKIRSAKLEIIYSDFGRKIGVSFVGD